ncbi:hypothetical protein YH66_02550 [[Brevibacterium] flavum]|uniref:Lipoprotein n=1 Tax=[Brevibacterium] flavum TaxID=92706 RepID=A0A0F6Z557_9CORY|nr:MULTISPECIES: hypothetical protein [Corynebacterium]AKF26510.1 hypothetical protein YH66_02550 [[Brevibacterium] flavum]ANE07335.1 hypothetical protein A3654_02530 [Corynebacterium glutamicum]AST19747.1 hypothetical protein CEY17_02575 [Corynebacterium glutamicum ATCC 14067]KEI22204.1 hypothetical protein KIQ_006355 [Corynebacterium glutamicum ATCC 14067]OKX94610.1 hypothetical protein AUP71_06615 [Corynebacterium glutamicum]
MKKTLSIIAAGLLLAGCGSPDAPARFEKIGHAEKWLNENGYECDKWVENSDTNAVCKRNGEESITISLDEDPLDGVAYYFEGSTWGAAAVGENWFSVCSTSNMWVCNDISIGDGLSFVPNPMYTK